MARRHIDPRKCNVLFDANVFDARDPTIAADVERLLELSRNRKIILVAPGSVRAEIENARTPAPVQEAALPQIFSLAVEPNDRERGLYQRVRDILRGNATDDRHDADAGHVAEAAKYGGYFVTHDQRINRTKRDALEQVLPPHLWIVTLAEFLQIYDERGGEKI